MWQLVSLTLGLLACGGAPPPEQAAPAEPAAAEILDAGASPAEVARLDAYIAARDRYLGALIHFAEDAQADGLQALLDSARISRDFRTGYVTALRVAYDDGRLKEGDLVVLCAFGAGFTWGSTLLRWTTA